MHKTSSRASYDLAYSEAEKNGGFDAIFVNEKNEVTEGGRSNFLMKKKGVMLTPPLECGLLPGIMRAELLNSGDYLIREEVIKKKDVNADTEIYLCNALRGLFKVRYRPKIIKIKLKSSKCIDVKSPSGYHFGFTNQIFARLEFL